MKNKYLKDILESLRRSPGLIEVSNKLVSMQRDYEYVSNSSLLEYVPIKIVACFEEYFRLLYKDIIDNSSFRKNIKKIKGLKEWQVDWNLIDAFCDNIITLGEYFSYYFPCNSLENINCNFSNLLGIDFLSIMKEKIINVRKSDDIVTEEDLNAVNLYIESISSIFDMRHTLCHEAYLKYSLDRTIIKKMINDATIFVKYTDEIVRDQMYPNAPITQAEMVDVAIKLYQESDKELTKIIEQIKKITLETNSPESFSYLDSWKNYRDCKAQDAASICDGGSMFQLIYYASLEKTTRQRIAELKQEFYNIRYKLSDF